MDKVPEDTYELDEISVFNINPGNQGSAIIFVFSYAWAIRMERL
jgi:hypothetical protein